MANHFKIKDLGQAKQILGVNVSIDREKEVITLDQKHYIDLLLSKFNMSECRGVDTPMEKGLSLSKDENNCDSSLPYRQLIGGLMYLAVMTRPDISYSVSYLSQFNNFFNTSHWKTAKRVLKYLQKTKNVCLKYKKGSGQLLGYVDADWGSDITDRRSYTGFCFTHSNSVISWESTKQKTVALSSTEAEYMALSEASKEAVHLRNLLSELTGSYNCVLIYCDNQSCIRLSHNPMFHKRTKHIDVRHHYVRDVVANKLIKLEYIQTNEMVADIFTKALSSNKHCKFLTLLGIVSIA